MPFFRSLVVMVGIGAVLQGRVDAVGRRAGRAATARRSDRRQLGGVGERSATVGGDDDGVLDAHAAVLGEVDAGLDGDDVAGGERSIAGRGHPGPLVDLEADAVAGGVQEGVAPAGVVDDRAAGRVDRRRPRRPAATASTPACWAASTTSTCAAGSATASPTRTVRVMSEQ